MRAAEDDPMKAITFTAEEELVKLNKKRRGKPRHHWTHQVLQEAMETCSQSQFDLLDNMHIAHLILQAADRQF